VWDELVGHAAAISLHAEFRDEAATVASELMQRVARNAAAIGTADAAFVDDIVARLVELGGPLPLSLDALWRTCATIDLRPAVQLRIVAPDHFFRELVEYEQRCAQSHREIVGPFVLPMIFADPVHDTVRYAIELPTTPLADAIDPVVVGTGLRLVGYLREAFAAVPGAEPF
jgi:hypothetical protein